MLVTLTEAAHLVRVKPGCARRWVERGLLTPAGHEIRKGRSVAMFNHLDVDKVEASTRKRVRELYPLGGFSSVTLDLQMLITTNQAACYAGVSPTTVRNWARRGLLPLVRHEMRGGRRVALYRTSDVVTVERNTRTRVRKWRLEGLQEMEVIVAGLPAPEPPAT